MTTKQLEEKLETAIFACESAGRDLLNIRNTVLETKTVGDQLKSAADLRSDKLVKDIIGKKYPQELIISEESNDFDRKDLNKNGEFWVLDPLDGTKSFHEGFSGFCVQIAFFEISELRLGVVYSPIDDTLYWASEDGGAYKKVGGKKYRINVSNELSKYIESRKAKGKVAEILEAVGVSDFIECGSYGLKICRVAEGKADVFIKEHNFKIWDVAPGDLILSEAGGILTTWSGKSISYRGKFDYKNLLACSQKKSSLILPKISQIVA